MKGVNNFLNVQGLRRIHLVAKIKNQRERIQRHTMKCIKYVTRNFLTFTIPSIAVPLPVSGSIPRGRLLAEIKVEIISVAFTSETAIKLRSCEGVCKLFLRHITKLSNQTTSEAQISIQRTLKEWAQTYLDGVVSSKQAVLDQYK